LDSSASSLTKLVALAFTFPQPHHIKASIQKTYKAVVDRVGMASLRIDGVS
jgi:hypothetical protein